MQANEGARLGRFLVQSILGQGGFGTVYRVTDPLRPGADLALKVLRVVAEREGERSFRGARGPRSTSTVRILEELRATQAVEHPSILKVFEAGVLDGSDASVYLVTEFCAGRELRPPMRSEDLEPITAEILWALDTIHAAGWRHGDIQPGNLLARRVEADRWEVRILDFGLAEEIEGPGAARSRAAGSPRYLSPEAIKGLGLDHRADLYSLGVVLFECLRGAFSDSVGEHLLKTRQGRLFQEVCALDLPEPLGRLLRRLLEPDPEARLASAREGLELLGAASRFPRAVPSFESPAPVGGEGFLASVREAVDSCSAPRPRPRLLLVEGETGLGKTRLLRQARDEAFLRGLRSIEWVEAREMASAAQPGISDAGDDLDAEGGAREREARFDREAEAITQLLLSERVLLLADDLDQLPAEDLRLVRSVLERLRASKDGARRRRTGDRGSPQYPAIVLCANAAQASGLPFRTTWKRLQNLPWATSHTLRPLSIEECRQYIAQVLRPRRALGVFEDRIIEDSAGHPDRLKQRLRELARTGDLRLEGGVWISKRPAERGLPPLPGERDRRRIEWLSLSQLEQDMLGLASVMSSAGDAPASRWIAEGLGVSEAEIEHALKNFRAGDFLPTVWQEGRGIRIDRPRRAWILRLAGATRRLGWRRLAARTESAPRAVRFREALRSKAQLPSSREILEAAQTGGIAAERLLARHAAAPGVTSLDRSAIARRLGELLLARGKLGRAEDTLEAALSFANAGGDDRAEIETLLGESALARRDGATATAWFAAASSRGSLNIELKARVLFGRAASGLLLGKLDEALQAAEEGVRERPELPQFHNLLGAILTARGSLREAEDVLERAIGRARKRGRMREEASARTNHGRLLMRLGRLGDAAAAHRAAADGFEAAGTRSEAAAALMNLGAVLRRAGDFAGSVEAAGRSLAIRRELGDDAGMALSEANLAILARELGLPGTALRHLGAAEEAAQAAGRTAEEELARNLLVLENRALLALDLGQVDEAQRLHAAASARRGAEPSPEELLLVGRLVELGRATVGMEARLHSRPFEERDAPGLTALARLGEKSSPLALEARGKLERIAQTSPRARFHLELLRCELRPNEPDASEALGHLEAHGAGFPERDARRRALCVLAGHPGTDAEARERARGLLRKLIDEVLFDMEPGKREAWRGRAEIQEAIQMASNLERRGGRSADQSLAVLREVFRINQKILDEGNVQSLVRSAVDAAIALTGAENGVLLLRRDGRLDVAAARTKGGDLEDALSKISRTVIERTLLEGAPVLATDAREDLSLRSIASVEDLGLRSVLCLPLRLRSKVAGALYLDNPFERAVFDSSDLEVTESFCAQAMLALRAAERRQQVAALLRQVRATNTRLHGELKLTRRDAERTKRSREKDFAGITGDSAALRQVFQMIEAVGPTEIPVLITGESGTGKELVARAICQESRRADRPFVAENCAAVPQGLLESALFGHVKGAFTGAESDRPGLFEMADGGTLFLDEVAEMPLELQTRLLRVLQEKEVRPIGSKRVLKVDVRVIAATNRNAREAVAQGKLREDLYYRLQGAEIHLPPLRERVEDIPLLAERFLAENKREGQPPKRLEPETLEHLMRYSWPGNVRELENEVRRAAVLAPGEAIGPTLLSPQVREGAVLRPAGGARSAREVRPLAEVEREAILDALRAFDGHRGKVAAALGISRSTLYLKLREIGYGD